MATSQKQQAERNIQKHRNYLKFIKKHYKATGTHYFARSGISILDEVIKDLINIEKRKKK